MVCVTVLIDERDNAEFLTVKLLFPDNNTWLVLVYGPQEAASEEETAMFYQKITHQIERTKLVGEVVILIDFNAELERNLIKSDIHDTSKNGKMLYMSYLPVLKLSL